jgi:hypothetical protein
VALTGEMNRMKLGMGMITRYFVITDTLPYSQVQASQFPVHISYLLQKCNKGKPCETDLPLSKNDITNIFDLLYLHFHSRYSRFRSKDFGTKSYMFYDLNFSRLKAEVKHQNGMGYA